ncbi:GNAT family N-acetyltransferase [Asticcacaulis endophyticus]|uniref:N-acetyltransferase n=1 Tax=Asticcacaulis endophyticus TaxID=1395890 RepID=A0A918Q1K5_9CAUL|nr:GNAT family N-acetyltransferase [Asticcacaulis endophyticus]GGZ30570.1 N-acetyltransferase [Asticcacaulis endophyticus]
MVDIAYARDADKAAWLPLWNAYLEFYQQDLPAEVTDLTWARCLNPDEHMYLLIARTGDEVTGFVSFMFHRSTWARGGYVYLEDLFVSEAQRGKGIARALIDGVTAQARELGAERVYWVTHTHNTNAQALYDKVATRTDFYTYHKVV